MKQNTGSNKKTLIMVIGIIIVLALGYFYFSGDTVPESANTLEVQVANTDGARILGLLNQIQQLRIDPSIFTSTAYQSLVDYSIEIPETTVGRPNPFAPIPGVAIPSQQGTTR